MTDSYPERVAFEFADRRLVGEVVDATTHASFNQPPMQVFTVEANGSQYTVSERDTAPA